MTIHDVLSPDAIALAKTLGYGVLLVGVAVILMAGLRLYLDAKTAYNRARWNW